MGVVGFLASVVVLGLQLGHLETRSDLIRRLGGLEFEADFLWVEQFRQVGGLWVIGTFGRSRVP
jgi:hypothetical protein